MSHRVGIRQAARPLVTLTVGATVAAGLVSVARQRREAQAIKRGDLPAAGASTQLAPGRPAGPIGARLAAWVPQRPRRRWTRTAAALWCAPLTLVGFVLAVAGGRLPRWDAARGCFVTRGVRGPSAFALRAVGADANAIGQVVLSRREDPGAALLAHETVHVRQSERLGPGLVVAYVWLGAGYGYRDHPLERAARAGAHATLTAAQEHGDAAPRDT